MRVCAYSGGISAELNISAEHALNTEPPTWPGVACGIPPSSGEGGRTDGWMITHWSCFQSLADSLLQGGQFDFTVAPVLQFWVISVGAALTDTNFLLLSAKASKSHFVFFFSLSLRGVTKDRFTLCNWHHLHFNQSAPRRVRLCFCSSRRKWRRETQREWWNACETLYGFLTLFSLWERATVTPVRLLWTVCASAGVYFFFVISWLRPEKFSSEGFFFLFVFIQVGGSLWGREGR